MFQQYFQDDVFFIVPHEIKEIILKELSQQKQLYRIQFLSLEEFKKHYFFDIKQAEALAFLYEKWNVSPSVLKEKLELLYQINPHKTYRNKKLKELVSMYQLLEDNGYLIHDTSFSTYIASFHIYLFGYPTLEPYEQQMLKACHGNIIPYEEKYPLPSIHAFQTQEEEICFVASEIKKLHQKGIPYRQVFLTGVQEEDTYLIKRIFHHFNIPLVGLEHPCLYATNIGKNYVLGNLTKEEIQDSAILKKIVTIENQLLSVPKEHPIYPFLLREAFKKETIELPTYEDAVEVLDFYHLVPVQDTYTFVIGFTQNHLPQVLKDEAYLSDQDVEELSVSTTIQKNQQYHQVTISLLKSLPHLTISFREKTLQNTYYPSSLIEELSLTVLKDAPSVYVQSKTYSAIRLGEMLDQYFLYGTKHQDLGKLFASFPNYPYRTYQHQYQPIPFFLSKEKPYYLSYTSLNDYALCPFKYYAKYILRLEETKQSFAAVLGNIYHSVLMHLYDTSFDFEESFQQAVSAFTLSKKEQVLLKRLKKELQFIIPVIEEQDSKSAYPSRVFEQKIEIPLGENVFLKGFIDKIAFCELYGQIHYVIYDYKTGSVTLDLNHIDEGLFLQLPLYQLLVEKGKLFSNPHFVGFFYQQLLLPSKNQQEKIRNLKLRGYLLDDEEAIHVFDESYENSEVVKGLKMTATGFSKLSKILSQEEVDTIKEKTWQQVLKMKQGILKGQFAIQPKRLKDKNISCQYCPFSDICYHDDKDEIVISEKEEVRE